jgi:Tfp pilus assembly protein PilO
MLEKSLEEKDEAAETKKIFVKKLNKFLNDYFGWIIVFFVFVVFVLGFFFLIQPKYLQTTRYVRAVSTQEKADFEAKSEELLKTKELLTVYKEINSSYIDKINAIAPVRKNKEELFPQINYLVSKNQLLLQSVSLGEVVDYQVNSAFKTNAQDNVIAQKIESVSVNLSVGGTDYDAFKRFLTALEDNLRLMDVVSVNFDPVSKTTSLTIITYYAKSN